jgi:hypothetical protein
MHSTGTIILPLWKSANHWPSLSPTGQGFISEVKCCIDLPTNKEYNTLGKGNKSVFVYILDSFKLSTTCLL